MNHEQALQLVGQANPLPGDSSGPEGFLSMTALLDRIDERSTDVQTQERPKTDERGPRQRPRWLLPALAGAAAVIIAILVGALLVAGGSEEPDVIEPTPTTTQTSTTIAEPEVLTAATVLDALNAAAAAGDWETVVGLFAGDATVTLGPGNADFEGSSNPRRSNTGFGPTNPTEIGDFLTGGDWDGSVPVSDWDGDRVLTGFDSVAQDTMIAYAMGFSVFESCRVEDPSTLVCVGLWDAHPFANTGRGQEVAIHTVTDGVITDTTWDLSDVDFFNGAVINRGAVARYEQWVTTNRSEVAGDAVLFILGRLAFAPETIELHRQLIAEWRELPEAQAPAPGDNTVTILIGDDSFEFDATPGGRNRCDANFRGAVWVIGQSADGSGGSLALLLPPPDDPNLFRQEPTIQVADDASGVDWRADPALWSGNAELAALGSGVESWLVDGTTVTGSATFVEGNAAEAFIGGTGELPEPIEGSFEIRCAGA